MITGIFTINNTFGLHARATSKLVAITTKFTSRIDITSQDQTVDGKSIINIMMLAAKQGSSLEIRCTGTDEKAAFSALKELIENDFGEN